MLGGIDRKWTPLNQPAHRWFNTVSDLVGRAEGERPSRIPDLRRARRLLMASDYSGDHQVKQGATYRGLSFLITDPSALLPWRLGADVIREKMLKDDREMAFKKRSDRVRAAAMPAWLRAANCIPGLCATVLIDRALDETVLTRTQAQLISDGAPPAVVNKWKPAPFERAMRTMFYGMTFVAGLARQPQSVTWVSDDDEMVPDHCIGDFARMAGSTANMLFAYKPEVRFTRVSDGERGRQSREDLCSIPDIAAGTLCRLNEAYIREGTERPIGKILPNPVSLTEDVSEFVKWHADDRWPLKRLIFIVQAGPGERIETTHFLQHAWNDPGTVVEPDDGIGAAAARQPIAPLERATIALDVGTAVTIVREPERWIVLDHLGGLLADSFDRVDALNVALFVLKARSFAVGYKPVVLPRSGDSAAASS